MQFFTVNMLHIFCIHIAIKRLPLRTVRFLYFLRLISVLFCKYVLEKVKNNSVVGGGGGSVQEFRSGYSNHPATKAKEKHCIFASFK